jgi:hypothetical protein
MKTYRLFFLFLLAGTTFGVPLEPPFDLKLESMSKSVRVGEPVRLRLKITGEGVHAITQNTPGILRQKTPSFNYPFEVSTEKEGVLVFGPYKMSVNGHILLSNRVVVRVLPKEQIKKLGTFFRVDKTSVPVGGEIEFTVETWSASFQRNPIRFIRSTAFSARPGATSLNSESGPHGMMVHKTQTWIITPKKAGDLRISRDLFEQFPENLDPPNILIQVLP